MNQESAERRVVSGFAGKSRQGEGGNPNFPIVGVGASAGGLEAFTELLKRLPLDTSMGFVLVQHLDPQHGSALTQLLTRATSMPVREVTNNLRVETNHIYVIPPNTNLGIVQGVLKLRPRPQTSGAQRSIDFFFESLAHDQGERAIGVILSGTATDGTLGLKAIKAEGGMTFAQDDSARYDSMPRSAVAAGCVDFILKPADIAKELARIGTHPHVARGPEKSTTDQHGAARRRDERQTMQANGFKEILLLLRNHSTVDFSVYKAATIQRRISRRMVLNKQNTLEGYANHLRGNARELDALYSDVLISVTRFFRNPEAFEVLKQKVFPKLLEQRGDEPLRVWVIGCSTGQEAYSIAMAFMESAERSPYARKLQVFATDLNEALLNKARQGLYARSLAQDVSRERLRRFFVEDQGGYQVIKPLREMVVFARQNVISDPPFSRMDLISCRNLLIYLEPGLQKKALPAFHYALKPEGFLFLGASESIGAFTDLFEPVDKKHKIYSRKAAPTPAFHLPVKKERGAPAALLSPHPMGRGQEEELSEAPEGFRGELNAQREADRVTVNQFAPPGVLINAELQILQFRGPTSAYLQPTGKASFDVLKMAREGLMLPLRAAINKASKENKTARRENVQLNQNGKSRTVNVEVIPLTNLREHCFLILFEDAEKTGRRVPAEATPPLPLRGERAGVSESALRRRAAELERELSETRDYLQSIQEQHEAANQELQASAEEVQSANEELQSINEELETSKEELESTNEELTTVNEEMGHRNAELDRANSDLTNLQASTKLPIVLLGHDLTVRRFSAQAEKQFNLLATDVGRPIGNVRHNLDLPDLEAFLGEVIATERERELEVRGQDGRWYSIRARPYLTLDNKVGGVLFTLVDIDALKRTEGEIRAARDYAEATVRTCPDSLIVLRADMRVDTANEAFYKTFKVSPAETEGRLIYDLGDGQWNIPRLRQFLDEIIARSQFFNDLEVTHNFPGIGRRTMLLNARKVETPEGVPHRILLGMQDITARLQAEEARLQLAAIVESSCDAIIGKKVDGTITSWNRSAERLFGYTAREAIGQKVAMLIPPDRANEEVEILERIKRGESIHYETVRLRKDASRLDVSMTISPVRDATGRVVGASKIARDITARKQAEEALRASEERFRALFDLGPVAVYSCDAAGVIKEFNRRAAELWGRQPVPGDTDERFCGSFRMHRPDGTFMPHEQCPMAEVLSGKISAMHDAEVTIERNDSSRITVMVNIRPLKNEQGEVTGAINCFYDITERKQAEQTVRENERRYRSLFESIDEGFCVIEVLFDSQQRAIDFVYLETNPAFEKQTGLHCVQGRRVLELVPALERHWFEVYGRIALTGEPVRFQNRSKVLGRWFDVYAFRVEAPELRKVAVLFTDITQQREADDALHAAQVQLADHAVQLEQLVAERTARLRETVHELEAFSYSISHDLRAPLRAMKSFAQLLCNEHASQLDPAGRKYLESISTAAARLDVLIQEVLNYTRILRGEAVLRRVQLDKLVRELIEAYPDWQPPKAEIQIEGTLSAVLGHEGFLTQVISNLIGNAIKFVAPGVHPKVRIWSEEVSVASAKPPAVKICFQDNGIGIAPENRERIFRMFERIHATSEFEGTGIGLTIVRKAMERMHGQMGFESKLGNGSTFWIELQKANDEGRQNS